MAEFTCFADKVVLITGAGGILGGGSALQFAKYGASLALIDIDQEKLETIVAKLQKNGTPASKIVSIVGDVTNPDDAKKIVDAAVTTFGKLNVLVNIVGVKRLGSIETCTLDDVDTCLNGTVRATFIMCKTATPHLIESKGNIVNMSSVSGIRAYHFGLPYGTSKAALNHMTQIMAAHLAKKGVRCNAVAPALTRADDPSIITEAMEKGYGIAARAFPMGRVPTVKEVTDNILYLASDSASFVTGAIMPIDGAYTQTLYEPPN